MHSWQDLRAEMLRQEILELELRPAPETRSAYVQHRQRLLKLKRELNSLFVEEILSVMDGLKDLCQKSLHNPEDLPKEEIVKAANDMHKQVEKMSDFFEKSSQHLRAGLLRNWQHASLSRRGKLAIIYSIDRSSLGGKRVGFRVLRFGANMLKRIARM